MKKETKAILALGLVIRVAILSHVAHNETVVKAKESFKFVKVKDWSEGATGYKLRCLKQLYNAAK